MVDHDEPVGAAVEEVDVALEQPVADRRARVHLPPVRARRRRPARTASRAPGPHQPARPRRRGRGPPRPGTGPRPRRRGPRRWRGRSVCSTPCTARPDRGAVAALEPGRQVEVAGPLLQPGIDPVDRATVVGAGVASSSEAAAADRARPARARPPTVGSPLVGEARWRRPRRVGAATRGRPRVGLPALERRGAGAGTAAVDGRATASPLRSGSRPSSVAHAGEEQLGVGAVARAWPASSPRLAVQRHDEVVAGAGAGDVEQPDALVVAHLLVDRHHCLELLGHDVLARAVADPAAVRGERAPRRGVGARRDASTGPTRW